MQSTQIKAGVKNPATTLEARVSTRATARKGKKGSSSVEQTEVAKKVPAKKTESQTSTQPNIFMRGIKVVPNMVGHLASSTCKAVKEVFLEGLVSYFVFSRAAGVASTISRATGADFNGMMGVLTVPVRKLATKAVSGLWNLVPSFNRQTVAASPENKGKESESLASKDANKQTESASGQDEDVPAGVDDSGIDSDTGSATRRRLPKVSYS